MKGNSAGKYNTFTTLNNCIKKDRNIDYISIEKRISETLHNEWDYLLHKFSVVTYFAGF